MDEQRRDYKKRTKREEAFKAIDGEREYQDKTWGTQPKTLSHWLVLINGWSELVQSSVNQGNTHKARDRLRKVAALAVAAMEDTGTIERDPRDQ